MVAEAVQATRAAAAAAATATVAVAATSAVAAAVTGSAAGGAAGGGAVSGLMGAQRLNLYGDLAGGEDIEATAASPPSPPSIMMCQLGLFSRSVDSNSTLLGRRLGTSSPAVTSFLLTGLADTAVTLLIFLGAAVVINVLVFCLWRCCVNRQFYASREKDSASFVPLPSMFAFPNFVLLVGTALMTGLMKVTFLVYGTYLGAYEFDAPLWSVAIGVTAVLFIFFAFQICQLRQFKRVHVQAVWKPAATTVKADDPLLGLLAKLTCGVVKPGPRRRGAFSPPAAWKVEPARTEWLLTGFFCCARRKAPNAEFTAGEQNEQLAAWLGDGTGTLLYKIVTVLLQVAITFAIAIFVVLKKQYDGAKNAAFISVMTLQLTMAIWHIYGGPVDRLKAIVFCVVSLLEVVGTGLMFASSLLSDWGHSETAVELGLISPTVLLYAVFVPLLLEFYDLLFLPVRKQIKEGRAAGTSWQKILTALLCIPFIFLVKWFKIGGAKNTANIGKMSKVTNKVAKKSKIEKKEVSSPDVFRATAGQPVGFVQV